MVVYLTTIERVKNFVKTVSEFTCDIDLISGHHMVDAKSILGIFSLDLTKPIKMIIHAEGDEEQKLIAGMGAYSKTR